MFFKNRGHDSFFDDINGKQLDKYQRKVVIDNSKYMLVVAGAGSGKTLSIIAKVKYLIERENLKKEDILCLSFTNETVNNLKNKLNYPVDVFTFHRLSLNILKENNFNYFITSDEKLHYIIEEYFYCLYYDDKLYQMLFEYIDKKLLNKKKLSYLDYCQNKRIIILKMKIYSFIKKIKSNNFKMKDIRRLCKKVSSKNDKIFLVFTFNILRIYQEDLVSENEIDFDDMISYATFLVKRNGLKRKYKYIIIDEYQDISLARFSLIKEILNSIDAKLMCVGDDYQSIYGFSGSSVALFIDFFKYFPLAKRIDIKNTYRNSYELIKTSCKFIMKNKYQLRKNIHATFLLKYPIILVYYENNYLETYDKLIDYLYLEGKKDILVLARYNHDLEDVIKRETKGLLIEFLTVHRAKGLECNNVILLKMEDAYLGFPSKIMNDNIFSLISKNQEKMEFAEERRLFYVALTRCKKNIYILVSRRKPSKFIEEIKSDCVELLLN